MLFAKMFLSPSVINFLYHDQHIVSQPLDVRLLDMSLTKILQNGDLPKIQVVEKDGHWFALNNSQLELCRRLEAHGKCKRVKVDVVPITEVPVQLRNMMVVPPCEKQKGKPILTKSCSLPQQSSSSSSSCMVVSSPSLVECRKAGGSSVDSSLESSVHKQHATVTEQQKKQHFNNKIPSELSSLSCDITSAKDIRKEETQELSGSISSAVTSGVIMTKQGSTGASKECDTSRTTGKGYQKIGQDVQEGCGDGDEDDPAEEEEASDDDSGSQESDTDDESDYESDSECDWSEDDGESSDEGATGSEAERASTDDERECLI